MSCYSIVRYNVASKTQDSYLAPKYPRLKTDLVYQESVVAQLYQALLSVNVTKPHNYWNSPYPEGISDIPKQDWIDIDECGIFVETANGGDGKAYIGVRVREECPYNHL